MLGTYIKFKMLIFSLIKSKNKQIVHLTENK